LNFIVSGEELADFLAQGLIGRIRHRGEQARPSRGRAHRNKLPHLPERTLFAGFRADVHDDALDQTAAPRGEFWNEISVKREAHGKLTVGLEIGGQLPVKFGIDYLRTTSVETKIRTLLAPGARYVAYAPHRDGGTSLAEQLEICWTTKA